MDSNICWWPDPFSQRKQCIVSEEHRSFINVSSSLWREDERRIEQPLSSLRWMKTDELLHHHDGHGFTSHIIRRGKGDTGRVTRGEHRDSKQIKKTTVSMSGCCGVIHNMQQTSSRVLKNPNKCSQRFCRRKRTRSFGVKHTEKWTQKMSTAASGYSWWWRVVSRWEWLKTACSVSMCSPVYYVSSLSYALPFFAIIVH